MKHSKKSIVDKLKLIIKCYVNENNLIIQNKVILTCINTNDYDCFEVKGALRFTLIDILHEIHTFTYPLISEEVDSIPWESGNRVILDIADSFTYPERDVVIYKKTKEKRTPTVRKYLQGLIKQQKNIWKVDPIVDHILLGTDCEKIVAVLCMANREDTSIICTRAVAFPRFYLKELYDLSELPISNMRLYLSEVRDHIWNIKLLYPEMKFINYGIDEDESSGVLYEDIKIAPESMDGYRIKMADGEQTATYFSSLDTGNKLEDYLCTLVKNVSFDKWYEEEKILGDKNLIPIN